MNQFQVLVFQCQEDPGENLIGQRQGFSARKCITLKHLILGANYTSKKV